MKTPATLLATAILSLSAIPHVGYSQSPTVRTDNLGVSGPTMDEIGGPGPHFLKFNSDPSAGNAVADGLMPPIRPLFDAQVRDAVVCVGHDGRYYLTGSTGDDIWRQNDGVEIWASSDLQHWEYMGLVWSFDADGTWQRAWRDRHGPVRALLAPELHYVSGNYFITYSMPPGDRGLHRSVSGLPTGPYVNSLQSDGKWDDDIDASLFQDDDGTVYAVWGGGWVARMKEDMSGLAEEPRKPLLEDPDTIVSHHAHTCPPRRQCSDIGHEGAFLFKHDGLYYLTAADTYEGRYSSMVAISENIYGPYRERHEAVPCGGGTGYFRDHEGRWWCSCFGNDKQAPFCEMPSLIRIEFTPSHHIRPALEQPLLDAASQAQWAVRWHSVWSQHQ